MPALRTELLVRQFNTINSLLDTISRLQKR